MKFYVDILGFEENIRTIEIYPTSNTWDLGVIDLYTLENSYNDIKFQCRYDERLFVYYPASNNEAWTLKTNLFYNDVECELNSSTPLEINDLLWIENERIRISNVLATNYYEIERGYNDSIAVNHFYTTDSDQIHSIPIISATLKRLSPLGLICKFYRTNNIGGELTVLGFGQISSISLSNNKLLDVTCKQLYKMLDKTYLFTNNDTEEYLRLYNFITYVNTDEHPVSNEFLRLLDIPDWFEIGFRAECKPLNELSRTTKSIKFTDIIQQLLMYNNAFIKFNPTTNRYTVQKLDISSSMETTTTSVFISSYLSLKDSEIEIKPFERISTLNGKFKIISYAENNELIIGDKEVNLKDDIISMASNKTLDYDLSSLYIRTEDIPKISKKLKDKIYFLNQVYDELSIKTSRWNRRFEVGMRYIFNDSHVIKTLVDKYSNTVWICLGYEDNLCKFISIESFNRYLISPFRKLTHSTGDVWSVLSLALSTSLLIYPLSTYEINDIVYVYTYKKSDQSITTTTKTLTNVSFSNNYLLTISGLSTDSDYVHFITYNYNYLTTKYKLFLYEGNGFI